MERSASIPPAWTAAVSTCTPLPTVFTLLVSSAAAAALSFDCSDSFSRPSSRTRASRASMRFGTSCSEDFSSAAACFSTSSWPSVNW
ncbi:hypothetical protein D3C71_1334140 [compost metagenome]